MQTNRNKKQPPKMGAELYVFAALMVVSFVLFILSPQTASFNFKVLGPSFFSTLRGGVYEVSSFISRTILSVRELAVLKREYEELSERMTRYEQLERTVTDVRQENSRIREQLELSETLRYRHIAAEIIGRDPDNLFSALVINKGTRHGIAEGMAVIAFHDGVQALAGRVIQSNPRESLVMPIYDASSYISSRFSRSRYEGIVEGQGNRNLPMVMRFIPKRARDEIGIGDLVISSGLGGVYPSEIVIGRVAGINFQDNETSMEVSLEASIDFSRLEYIFVVGEMETERQDG